MFASLENLGQFSPIGMILPGFAPFTGASPSSAPVAAPTSGCPNGIFTNNPTAPLYDARYQQQKDALHSSGLIPFEPCPPTDIEGGRVSRGQEFSLFFARNGTTYITTSRGWGPCPVWPTPLSNKGTLAETIYGARVWVDQAAPVMAWAADIFGTEGNKLVLCPGYPKALDGSFGIALSQKMDMDGYTPFVNYIWSYIFPEGGANILFNKWMNTRGTYQVPTRPDPNLVAMKADYLNTLVKAWDTPPWPHRWFKSFMTRPLVAVPPFYKGYKINDPTICESDYFPRDPEQIKHDIAVYLSINEKLLNEHFLAEANAWIAAEEAKMQAMIRRQKTMGWITTILDIFTFGMASAAMALVKLGEIKDALKRQTNDAKLMANNFDVTDKQMEDFSLWIVHYYGAPPLKVPGTGVNEAPAGRYSIYVEQKPIRYANTTDDALRIAFSNSKTGERILVKDGNTGEAVGYFIREEKALRKAPASIAGTLQAMSPGTAKSMVSGGSGFPVWLAAVPIAMKVMKVI
jgi:hypothetical protein